jgi:molybdate transport system ATP-binding protein
VESEKTIRTNDANLAVRLRKNLSSSFSLEVEFSVPPGITILFGPSGAGKTTLLKCIAGLSRPDAGRIAAGSQVLFDSEDKINVAVARRSIGYVFQNLALFPHLTAEQNVQYGLAKLGAATRSERAMAALASFRIADLRQRKPGEISGGERQRVALARSLVTDPRVLLLDEPLAALDHKTKSGIIDDLRAWNSARGIPILYVTHAHSEVFALGERAIVLENGRVLAQGTPQQVLDTPAQETIAQLAGFENIFDASVVSTREDLGLMRCKLSGSELELEVPLARAKPGSGVRLAIRAGDILLATELPRALSARNILPGKLASLEQQGVMVIAEVDAGGRFEVHLTPSARESLQLRVGQQVWLVIKTYSCHLVSAGAGTG